MNAAQAASLFPSLADAPLRPFEPSSFAAWTVKGPSGTGAGAVTEERALQLLVLAGFVLAHVPPAERSPLVAALAWPSPADEKHGARALSVLAAGDLAAMRAALRGAWLAEGRAKVEQAIRCALTSPADVARLLRMEVYNTNGVNEAHAKCPKSGGMVWAPSRDAPGGQGTIASRQEPGATHRCLITLEGGALRFRCGPCRLDGDVFLLVAAVRGINPLDRAAVLREAAGFAAAVRT
jgi:hypothetical protein